MRAALVRSLENTQGDDSFEDKNVDYYRRFETLDEKMAPIHRKSETGPALRDNVWVTDHGESHISKIIERASDIVGDTPRALTPYETYLLLVAIHLHDTGMAYGRVDHEQHISEIMTYLGPDVLGDNVFELRMIKQIAMAHSGSVNGDRDTIGKISYPPALARPGKDPRVQLLAAILRMSDELAEDHRRTDRLLLDGHMVNVESEIYHKYASSLKKVAVMPEANRIYMKYELTAEMVSRKYRKGPSYRYLIDEIKSRLLKLYLEIRYCQRFMRPHGAFIFDVIDIEIGIYDRNYNKKLAGDEFTLEDGGYPIWPTSLRSICPKLDQWQAQMLRDKFGEPRTARRPRSPSASPAL